MAGVTFSAGLFRARLLLFPGTFRSPARVSVSANALLAAGMGVGLGAAGKATAKVVHAMRETIFRIIIRFPFSLAPGGTVAQLRQATGESGFTRSPCQSNGVLRKEGRPETREDLSLEAKRNATRIEYFVRKNRRRGLTHSVPGATRARMPRESEVMKLRSLKAKLLLILLCGGLSSTAIVPAAAQVSPASPPGATAGANPSGRNQFPYGLLGLLGLLGLAGLIRRKDKSDKDRASGERPPAPSGSYVSDMTKDPPKRAE